MLYRLKHFFQGIFRRFSRPQDTATLYHAIGGAEKVQALSQRFYDLMAQEPQWAALHALHRKDHQTNVELFYWFLSGWLGGPALYMKHTGHPRLRARHLHLPIDEHQITLWLGCFEKACAQCIANPFHRQQLIQAIRPLAQHMHNQTECPVSSEN